jgi:hypothetical protein
MTGGAAAAAPDHALAAPRRKLDKYLKAVSVLSVSEGSWYDYLN